MVFIVFILSVFVRAESMELLLSASDIEGLMQSESVLRESSSNSKKCRTELKKQWFPYHCLEELQFELGKPQNTESLMERVKLVERACLSTYTEIRYPEHLSQFMDSHLIPRRCRKALQNHLQDLIYIER